MKFPFVTRSLYDSRTSGLQIVIASQREEVRQWANANLELEKTITQLKNRVANLNNAYDQASNSLGDARANVANLRNALAESDTIVTRLTAENDKLKCSKTSSKRKKKD